MLVGAGFFGYMLALLQRRVGTIVASQDVSSLSLDFHFWCTILVAKAGMHMIDTELV